MFDNLFAFFNNLSAAASVSAAVREGRLPASRDLAVLGLEKASFEDMHERAAGRGLSAQVSPSRQRAEEPRRAVVRPIGRPAQVPAVATRDYGVPGSQAA